MPFLMSFTLEPEIVTLAWIDIASVQWAISCFSTASDGRRSSESQRQPESVALARFG